MRTRSAEAKIQLMRVSTTRANRSPSLRFAGRTTHQTNFVHSERETLNCLSFASVRTRSSSWIIFFHFLFLLTDVHFL
jgi:hypothetical protein